jgi:hypothetical protein
MAGKAAKAANFFVITPGGASLVNRAVSPS